MSHARSNLNLMGKRIYTGAADDHVPSAVEIDCTDLPESHDDDGPANLVAAVNEKLHKVDKLYKSGHIVLIKSRFGLSRSVVVAKLYLIGQDEPFRYDTGRPNTAWKEFAETHFEYYRDRIWDHAR